MIQGLKTDPYREDIVLLQLMVQTSLLSRERFGELKLAMHSAKEAGEPFHPIEQLLEAREVLLDDWQNVLAIYEAEYLICPGCQSFLRAPAHSPQMQCGKCQQLVQNITQTAVVAVARVEGQAPPEAPAASAGTILQARDAKLLELGVHAELLTSADAGWASEKLGGGDLGAVLCGSGMLGATQFAELESQLEADFFHCPVGGSLVSRDQLEPCPVCGANHSAAPAVAAAVVPVSIPPEPQPGIRRRGGKHARYPRRPAAARLEPEQALRFELARNQVTGLGEALAQQQALAQQAAEAAALAQPATPEPEARPRSKARPVSKPRVKSKPKPKRKAKRKAASRPPLVTAPDPAAPRLEGESLEALLAGDVIDLSGMTIVDPIDLSDRKLKSLTCRQTYFEQDVDLRGATLTGKAVFREAAFVGDFDARECRFSGGADFSQTHFLKLARFNQARFARYVHFREATFRAAARFSRARFLAGAGFEGCSFLDEMSFNDLRMGHRARFERCTFDKTATFSNSTFEDVFDISGSVFAGLAKFMNCEFDKPALFNNVTFQSHALFIGTLWQGEASFRGGCFQGKVDFKGICAERTLLFQGLAFGEQACFHFAEMQVARFVVHRADLEGRLESELQGRYGKACQEYGLLKHSFAQINAYRDEDWAYLMEKRMARKSIVLSPRYPQRYLARLVNWLALDLACGYGTRPLSILAAALLVIVAFGLVYLGAVAQLDLPQALLVSFKAFTGAQIDTWGPRAGHPLNFLLALENFLGIFVMTVLVVTFSRKVIR